MQDIEDLFKDRDETEEERAPKKKIVRKFGVKKSEDNKDQVDAAKF